MEITNPELILANDFVKHTDSHIYLTGKAGTGKTTFLHNLKASSHKRMIVTAPTGVAAINAGGVTLHSFFQLPFGPYLPGSESQQQNQQRRFNKEKIDIIKSLDLLVIDEISMVRADLLDGVDAVLRKYKHRDRPFGGVQLLMIGDLHQLSPVVKDEEWQLLKPFYNTCYFFSSIALKQTQMVSIELKHIYRQSDADFIDLLNKVRDNCLDQDSLQLLNSRHIPDFQDDDNNYITLSTHNRMADEINDGHLANLDSKSFTYKAIVEGDYPKYNFPTAEQLALKKGAQVMFVRNDSSPEKNYFNGKIGKIVSIDRNSISVKCPGDAREISVEKITWENIKYTLDKKTNEISEDVVGSFYQFPLRMAWAITIHKSQGLTFEHAIIDASSAFSHGQVYVALSRCKTFEGMVLSTPISQRAVKTDRIVTKFTEHVSHHLPTEERLNSAKTAYQQKLVVECFDYILLHKQLNSLMKILQTNMQHMPLSEVDIALDMQRQTADDVIIVADKFKRQLSSLFVADCAPQDNQKLQERVKKATEYFLEKLQAGIVYWIDEFSFNTSNNEVNKQVVNAVNKISYTLAIKVAALMSCKTGFDTAEYLNALAHAELKFKPRVKLVKN